MTRTNLSMRPVDAVFYAFLYRIDRSDKTAIIVVPDADGLTVSSNRFEKTYDEAHRQATDFLMAARRDRKPRRPTPIDELTKDPTYKGWFIGSMEVDTIGEAGLADGICATLPDMRCLRRAE